MGLGLMGLMASGGAPWLTSARPNPFADVHGWEQAGARAKQLAAQHGLHAVAVQNWTLASRLGWYARPLPVHVLEDRFDQFDLWAGKLPAGGSTLLVDWSQLGYTVPLGDGLSAGFGPSVGAFQVSTPGNDRTLLGVGAAAGMNYRAGALYTGFDIRYHATTSRSGVDYDPLTFGAKVGINF